jgi:hypothetical protein
MEDVSSFPWGFRRKRVGITEEWVAILGGQCGINVDSNIIP